MSRTILNFLLDAALLLVLTAFVGASAILRLVFPAPTGAGGWTLWGFDYNAWNNFQFNLLAVMLLGVLVHVMLHWSWVCGVIAQRARKWTGRAGRLDDGTQTLYGVVLLIGWLMTLGALVAAARLSLERPARRTSGAPFSGATTSASVGVHRRGEHDACSGNQRRAAGGAVPGPHGNWPSGR